jgi:hypothetical protein
MGWGHSQPCEDRDESDGVQDLNFVPFCFDGFHNF